VSARGGRVSLLDEAESPGRTTATLLASLMSRLATLYAVSGADAVGSLVAGYAELGRAVGATAEGARMRSALEAGRPGLNGSLLWSELRLDEWASTLPPSPVLDQLRNDLALLLADDLETALDLAPVPAGLEGRPTPERPRATFTDFALGLWAFSRELVAAVDALAAPTLEAPGRVVHQPPPEPAEGTLLR
jgi:hypothetical protein